MKREKVKTKRKKRGRKGGEIRQAIIIVLSLSFVYICFYPFKVNV